MTFTWASALKALILGLSAAAQAVPQFLALRVSRELRDLDAAILAESRLAKPDRAKLLQLEADHARLRRLYALLCPSTAKPEGGAAVHAGNGRDLGQPAGPS